MTWLVALILPLYSGQETEETLSLSHPPASTAKIIYVQTLKYCLMLEGSLFEEMSETVHREPGPSAFDY